MPVSSRRYGVPMLLAVSLVLAAGCGDDPFDHPMLEQKRAMQSPVALWPATPVPDLRLPSIGGDTVALRLIAGKGTTVVNLWATWCVPCREEMPALVRLQEKRGGEAFRVVGIAVDSELDGIRRWIRRYGIDFTLLYGMSRADMEEAFGTFGLPRTYVVTRDTVRIGLIGSRTLDQLEAAVDSL